MFGASDASCPLSWAHWAVGAVVGGLSLGEMVEMEVEVHVSRSLGSILLWPRNLGS